MGDGDVDSRGDFTGARAHRSGDRPLGAFEFLVVGGDAGEAHVFGFCSQGSLAGQGARAALGEVDAV